MTHQIDCAIIQINTTDEDEFNFIAVPVSEESRVGCLVIEDDEVKIVIDGEVTDFNDVDFPIGVGVTEADALFDIA